MIWRDFFMGLCAGIGLEGFHKTPDPSWFQYVGLAGLIVLLAFYFRSRGKAELA